MDTVTVLTILQIVAMSAKCSQDIMDLIKRAKAGDAITQAELDEAMLKAKASADKWDKAADLTRPNPVE